MKHSRAKGENAMTKLFFGFVGALVIAGIVGWIMNIVKLIGLAGQSFEQAAVELIIRAIGIFLAPLGAIAGFF